MTLSVTFQHPEQRLILRMIEGPRSYINAQVTSMCHGRIDKCIYTGFLHTPIQSIRPNSKHCTKNTIYQLTTMLGTSTNVLFISHNHLLTTSTGTLIITQAPVSVPVVIAGGYDLGIGQV